MRVLLADDDRDFLALLRLQVADAVHVRSVDEATTVGAGVRAVRSNPPYDLLIVDHRFPDGSGVEIVEAARALETSSPELPWILLLTGVYEVEVIAHALARGANDFLLKPPRPAELTARLQVAQAAARSLREMTHEHARLHELAMTDPLLGLPNRRAVESEIRRRSAHLRRYAEPFAVVALDVDDFKQVNDTHGHQAGDELLRQIATTARTALRREDMFGRIGGDEFVAVVSGRSREDLRQAVARLREAMTGLRVAATGLGGHQVDFRAVVSIGATFVDDGTASPAELLLRADERLYRAKRRPRVGATRASDDNSPRGVR